MAQSDEKTIRSADGDRAVMIRASPRAKGLFEVVASCNGVDHLIEGRIATQEEAVRVANAYVGHIQQKKGLQRTRDTSWIGRRSPWGRIEDAEIYGKGIVSVVTSKHGGFKLSPQRLRAVPEVIRHEDGWFEANCDWTKVAIAFPDLFTSYERHFAESTLKSAFPYAYEMLREPDPRSDLERIQDALDERFFRKNHANELIQVLH